MGTPLRKRLGMSDRGADTRTDRGVMARTLMYPFALGGALALTLALLGGGVVRFALTAALCWAVAALLLTTYDAMPDWSFLFLTVVGTALLLWTVYAGGPGAAQACAPL